MTRGFEAFRNTLVHDPMQLVQPLMIFFVMFERDGWSGAVLRGCRRNARTESRAGRILYEGLRGR
jgi:hypothetical protein